jgi:hypothetical protein
MDSRISRGFKNILIDIKAYSILKIRAWGSLLSRDIISRGLRGARASIENTIIKLYFNRLWDPVYAFKAIILIFTKGHTLTE